MTKSQNEPPDYDPEPYERFPHVLYQCPGCGRRSVAIGWEVEALVCGDCNEQMEHHIELHHPRSYE